MELFRFEFVAMASRGELQLWGEEGATRAAAAAAIADVRRIEAKYSRYREDSLTTAINRAAGRAPVAIDAETAALLDYAGQAHALSGGAFDLTAGVLRQAWDFKAAVPRVPDAATVAALTAKIGWPRLERDGPRVFLPAGMELDFGGIGKEYAADRAATCCREQGIAHGLVNLGGDIRVLGAQPDGGAWQVGIRHPRIEAVATRVPLVAGALATSGDYERGFEIGGRRYCHILDARSGWPPSTWQSMSVVSGLCIVAGTLATIAMLLGEAAPDFLAAQGVDWLGYHADGRRCGPLAVQLDESVPGPGGA